MWRQDLVILSPEGRCDSTCQLRPSHRLLWITVFISKNHLRLFFASKNHFYFVRLSLNPPPKIPFKTSVKITLRGYSYFLRLFFASRGYFKQKPQKILRDVQFLMSFGGLALMRTRLSRPTQCSGLLASGLVLWSARPGTRRSRRFFQGEIWDFANASALFRGQNPKGPKIEKIQSRLKFSMPLENFNLAWKFQNQSLGP